MSVPDMAEVQHRLTENIASLTFGWCCALAIFCTTRIYSSWTLGRAATKRYAYFLLCAFLVFDSTILAIAAWTFVIKSLPHGPLVISLFLLLWSIQIHIYLQLIINRICILGMSQPPPRILRGGVAVLTLLTNIAMLCFWLLPQITDSSTWTAPWFPRMEKVIYILLDVALNTTFIIQVRNKLMRAGLFKYRKLIHYNLFVIALSLLCDALSLGMQWFSASPSMFIMIHPFVFLNKCVLEMSICDYMAKISREQNILEILSLSTPSPRYQEFPENESFRGVNSKVAGDFENRPRSESSQASSSPALETEEEYHDFLVNWEIKKQDMPQIVIKVACENKVLPKLPVLSPLLALPLTYQPRSRSNLSYYAVSI